MSHCHLFHDTLDPNGKVISRQGLSDTTLTRGLGKGARFEESDRGASATFYLQDGVLTTRGTSQVAVEVAGSRKPICLTGKTTRIVLIAE